MARDSLISFPVRGIFNGVSQQPTTIRREGFAETQENGYSSIIDGLKKRPPSEAIKKLKDYAAPSSSTTIDGVHFVDRGASEQHVILIEDGEIDVYGLDGVAKTVTLPDGDSYLDTSIADAEYKFLTLADVTFIVNPEKTVVAHSDVSPDNSDTVTDATSGGHSLIFLKGSAGTGQYKYTVAGNTTGSTNDSGDMTADAATIASVINGYSNIKAVSAGPVIHLWRTNTATAVTVLTTHTNGEDYIETIQGSVEQFNTLPVFGPHGFILQVTGAPESTFDDYYVKFVAKTSTTLGVMEEGNWVETVAPGIPIRVDYTTMPHVLITNANGTFTFAKADGAHIETFKWASRAAGDAETNKDPGFVGHKIKDIFFHKNRLGLVANDTIVLSEAGEFFNFYTVSVVDSLASDCMNVVINHTNAVNLHSAVSFQDDLLVFGDNDQFKLTGDPVLSNDTVQATLVSSYRSTDASRPLVSSNRIFFGFDRGDYNGVYQLTPSLAVQGQYIDTEITLHIPTYIPSSMRKMAAFDTENLICGLTSGEPGTIFAYKYFSTGTEAIQSSWSKFTFRNSNIRGFHFVNNALYMVNRRSDAWYLEKIPFRAQQIDTDATYMTHVDRRIKNTDATVTYDSAADRTLYSLPYKIGAGEAMTVVTRSTASTDGGNILKVTSQVADTVNLYVEGNHLTTPVWIGEKYTMTYEFSVPTLRDKQGQVMHEGRLQLRRGTVEYSSTGYFRIEVTPSRRDTYSYPYTGRMLGSAGLLIGDNPVTSGTFNYAIRSQAKDISIKVINDSPLPSNISAANFEGSYSSRSARL